MTDDLKRKEVDDAPCAAWAASDLALSDPCQRDSVRVRIVTKPRIPCVEISGENTAGLIRCVSSSWGSGYRWNLFCDGYFDGFLSTEGQRERLFGFGIMRSAESLLQFVDELNDARSDLRYAKEETARYFRVAQLAVSDSIGASDYDRRRLSCRESVLSMHDKSARERIGDVNIPGAINVSDDTFCGVYFLIRGNEIVYVGQSVNVPSRINQHRKDKRFDRAVYVPCTRQRVSALERHWIERLDPEYNLV